MNSSLRCPLSDMDHVVGRSAAAHMMTKSSNASLSMSWRPPETCGRIGAELIQ